MQGNDDFELEQINSMAIYRYQPNQQAIGLPGVDYGEMIPAAHLKASYAKSSIKTSQEVLVTEGSPASHQDDDNALDDPRNWPKLKKAWATFIIVIYTFVVYSGSAITVPSTIGVIQTFEVSIEQASLVLAIYVLGYGIGPLIFSPLSEIPWVGRKAPYVWTFALFQMTSILAANVDNFSGLLFLRFAQGFLGSPALATGAASLDDLYGMTELPYANIFWIAAMYCGPALGPLMSGYLVAWHWRWSLWEIVIMSSVTLLLLMILPETSVAKIRLQRSPQRTRLQTDMQVDLRDNTSWRNALGIISGALAKPLEITIKDPAICFTALYAAIMYGTYYSFFEAFPLVYGDIYHFDVGEISAIFTVIGIAVVIVAPCYGAYLRWIFLPKAAEASFEDRLGVAVYASFFPPIGLLIFAFTSNKDTPWIWPTFGVGVFAGSSFLVFQCLICYVPLSYPRYVASLLAANDFFRSIVAAGFVMFSRSMYIHWGVRKGVGVLAAITTLGVVGMLILRRYGAAMRARSRFAIS